MVLGYVLAGLALGAGIVGCASPLARLRTRTVMQQYQTTRAVMVTCPQPDGTASVRFGTGVMVSDHQAMTAHHVVDCPGAIILMDGSLEPVQMRVELRDANADVVRLGAIEGYPFDAAPVRVGLKPAPGDTICIVSAIPRVGRRCGEVQWYTDDGFPDIMHNVITEHGNSGGPVYNLDGDLVGIVSQLWLCSNGQICGGKATSLFDRRWMLPA